MSFARIATLRVSEHSYDLMYFRYGFGRKTDKKGRPSTGINGGTIVLTVESTKSTELLERFLNTDPGYPANHPPRAISGSIEVCDPEDGMAIRKLVFEEAFLVQSGEQMHTDSPLPMMETITISTLRLDVDRTIRLDRRWPQTSGGWREYVQEEQPQPVSFMESLIAKVENEKNQATAHPVPSETFGGNAGLLAEAKAKSPAYKRNMEERRKALIRDAKDPNSELSDRARKQILESNGKKVPRGYEVSHEQPLYTSKTTQGKKSLDKAENMKTRQESGHRKRHKVCGDQYHEFGPANKPRPDKMID